jgi:AcrR family transcriptional regulator
MTYSRFPEQRRLEVVEVTLQLVIEHGYEETTMEAIAAATSSSKATLYRQWRTKAALVADVVKRLSGIQVATIDTGALVGDLTALMKMLAEHADRNVPLALGLAGASQRDPTLRDALIRHCPSSRRCTHC